MASEGTPEGVTDLKTTETPARYLAYVARIRPLLMAGTRYLAFTSDVGEAFRPVSHINIVRAAYAISWGYVASDIGLESYKEYERGGTRQDMAQVAAKRAVFQTLASMALPSLAVHTTVKYAGRYFNRIGRFTKWGPTIAGLALIPALPYMFDHPIEYALDAVWPDKHHHPHFAEPTIEQQAHFSPLPPSPESQIAEAKMEVQQAQQEARRAQVEAEKAKIELQHLKEKQA
eukprot:TRINITY_DN2049_c0_g1_i1.p1 TRINITY_DN2049_c0_g1~~TRINITY_DN2049_c0_g1_i1.p1  ORF type:complete len:231 (-),score=78.74 TRINITY_DN2049_c0_g1_i1:117-809(-)